MNNDFVKFKICKNMICAFDQFNTCKQKESEISHVLVIKRHRWRPFGKTEWVCVNADDLYSDEFIVPEHMLSPENTCSIRYPISTPDFNDIDIESLEYIYNLLLSNNIKISIDHTMEYLGNAFDTKVYDKHVSRIKGIIEKIKFCKRMRDV